MIEKLLEKKAELQKKLDALDKAILTLKDFYNGEPTKEQIGGYEGGVGKEKSKGKLAPHEGITEGASGDCTTTFLPANPNTTFRRATVDKDGNIVQD